MQSVLFRNSLRAAATLGSFLYLSCIVSIVNSDPEPLQDICVADISTATNHPVFFINGSPCINPSLALPSHFATSVLSKPGVNTQGVTMGRVDIAPNGLVPLHWHPRASEIALLIQGHVLVGFADTSNRLFSEKLSPGDSFVFPRGMVHFVYNLDSSRPALVISGLNSQNPGAEIAALAMFTSNPPFVDEVLQKTVRMGEQDSQRIRKNLGG